MMSDEAMDFVRRIKEDITLKLFTLQKNPVDVELGDSVIEE